ncbi:unnamed protein product, partial [Oikopleura dioica]
MQSIEYATEFYEL